MTVKNNHEAQMTCRDDRNALMAWKKCIYTRGKFNKCIWYYFHLSVTVQAVRCGAVRGTDPEPVFREAGGAAVEEPSDELLSAGPVD